MYSSISVFMYILSYLCKPSSERTDRSFWFNLLVSNTNSSVVNLKHLSNEICHFGLILNVKIRYFVDLMYIYIKSFVPLQAPHAVFQLLFWLLVWLIFFEFFHASFLAFYETAQYGLQALFHFFSCKHFQTEHQFSPRNRLHPLTRYLFSHLCSVSHY